MFKIIAKDCPKCHYGILQLVDGDFDLYKEKYLCMICDVPTTVREFIPYGKGMKEICSLDYQI